MSKSSASFMTVAAIYSPDDRYDSLFISNYVLQNVLDAIKRVPGTTNVQIFGAKDYAMRIWLQARIAWPSWASRWVTSAGAVSRAKRPVRRRQDWRTAQQLLKN